MKKKQYLDALKENKILKEQKVKILKEGSVGRVLDKMADPKTGKTGNDVFNDEMKSRLIKAHEKRLKLLALAKANKKKGAVRKENEEVEESENIEEFGFGAIMGAAANRLDARSGIAPATPNARPSAGDRMKAYQAQKEKWDKEAKEKKAKGERL